MNTIAVSEWDRCYTYVLLFIAYVLPMGIIVRCNFGIIRNNQKNNKEIMEIMELRKRGSGVPVSDPLFLHKIATKGMYVSLADEQPELPSARNQRHLAVVHGIRHFAVQIVRESVAGQSKPPIR